MAANYGYCLLLSAVLMGLSWEAAARTSLDQQVSLRTFSGYLQNPNGSESLFPSKSDVNQQVILRDSIKIKPNRNVRFEINVFGLLIGASSKDSLVQTLLNASDETNRTADLERHWHNSTNADGYLTVDRLNLSLRLGQADLTIGRFPVNLSTMFVFVPNDFFAPFRAFDYYREFKPGVDGVRFDYALGRRGQLSVLGLAGFQSFGVTSRTGGETKPSRNYSPINASALVRGTYAFRRFELGMMGGKVGPGMLGGFSLQGELGDFGIRAEGNQRSNQLTKQKSLAIAGGLDYRLTSKFSVQAEQYFNGGGLRSASELVDEESTGFTSPTLQLGRLYTALTGIYDITGVLNLKTLLIVNDGDKSMLGNLFLTYSVAANANLVVAFMMPRGKPPADTTPETEYGLYPSVLSIQTAVYF
ncbi:MAG: hypothetical protein RL011_1215 [Pseudomonadota bacterium]|jgi:hypothetical protein